jgi:hypothetical protein
MITADGLIRALTRNADYLSTHLAGLTHADALVQPPVRGNCLLWIVGHIVCYRNYMLNVLGLPRVLPVETAQRFARGSAPVLGEETGLPRLEQLMQAYANSQARVFEALPRLTAAQAAEVVTEGDFTLPRAELVMSYMRHESYHAGQLELLREIALAQRG